MNPSSNPIGAKGARFGGHLLSGLVLLTPLLAQTTTGSTAPLRGYGLTEVLAKSEPDTVMSAVNGWHGAYGPGKRQYAWSWAEAGVRGDHWGLGTLVRWDYDLRFSNDAAALYGAIQNHKPLPVGRIYHVAVQAHIVHASGLRASWRGDLSSSLRTEFGFSVLRSNYMMEGSLDGTASVTGPKTYDYLAATDYAYTKDVLFDRSVSPQDGLGCSMDAACDWRFLPDWRIQAQVRDLPGGIWWPHLPYTDAGAASNRTSVNSQGYTQWAALVSGVESNHRLYHQNLPTRGELELSHGGWQTTPLIGLNYQFDDWLPRVGLGRNLGGTTIQGWIWPTTRALGIKVEHGSWQTGLAMDNLQWGLVKAVSLTFGYNL